MSVPTSYDVLVVTIMISIVIMIVIRPCHMVIILVIAIIIPVIMMIIDHPCHDDYHHFYDDDDPCPDENLCWQTPIQGG